MAISEEEIEKMIKKLEDQGMQLILPKKVIGFKK